MVIKFWWIVPRLCIIQFFVKSFMYSWLLKLDSILLHNPPILFINCTNTDQIKLHAFPFIIIVIIISSLRSQTLPILCLLLFSYYDALPWLKLEVVHTAGTVNRGEWLWNSRKFFVVCFCPLFWTWLCSKHNSRLQLIRELANRNVLVMQLMQCTNAKQKIARGCGSSNITLVIFVCSFDVCHVS